MKKIVIAALMIFLLPLTLHATDYMTIEEIERIWGDDAENIVFPKTKPSPNRSMDITELIDEYAQSAEFIKTMQYLEPNEDFGGIMEGEHLLDIIQTDNTTESIWIWSRYYQLTGDNQYYQNILNSWQYIYRWPAWREEGGSHPSNGYYRYYGGGWGLLAEMLFRDAYGTDTFSVYADSVADYMINHHLQLSALNTMVYSWAMGALYLYGVNTGVPEYIHYADSISAEIKAYVDVSPSIRLSREQWAMSGGATMWGLLNSYFLVHPEEAFDWVTENAVYLDTLDTIGSWHMAHNAWYALAHWGAFQVTEDSTYFYNHAFLTDTLWLMDTDDDGGIQAEFDDTENMDQSWCTAYLGMMCFDPLLTPGTFIGDYRENLPGNFAAASNYPNPFNSSTNIRYRGFPQENITVEAFDILGRKVDTVFDGLAERSGLLNWNASGFSSGVYFLRVSGIDRSAVTRAILVK